MKLPAPHVSRFPVSRLVPACLLALGLLGGCAQTQPYQAPKVAIPTDAWHDQNWQAAQPALNDSVPYIVALIELDVAPNVRLIGNLLGDPDQQVEIGAPVRGVFEPHERDGIAFALLQWRRG